MVGLKRNPSRVRDVATSVRPDSICFETFRSVGNVVLVGELTLKRVSYEISSLTSKDRYW